MSDLSNVASAPLVSLAGGATNPMFDRAESALPEARFGVSATDGAPKIFETGASESGMQSGAKGGENPYDSSYYPAPPFTLPPDIWLAENAVKSEAIEAQEKDVVRADVQVETLQADVAEETSEEVAEDSPIFAPAAPAIATEDTMRKDAIAYEKAEAAVAEVRAIQETSTEQSHSSVV